MNGHDERIPLLISAVIQLAKKSGFSTVAFLTPACEPCFNPRDQGLGCKIDQWSWLQLAFLRELENYPDRPYLEEMPKSLVYKDCIGRCMVAGLLILVGTPIEKI